MWDRVVDLIGDSAPMIGGLVGGPLGKRIGTMIASTLGVENTPEAIEMELRNNPDALIKLKQIESSHSLELQRLMLEQSRIDSNEFIENMKIQSSVQKAEINSDDKFVRRWRPMFGYAFCFTWVMMFLGLFAVTIFEPKEAANVVNAYVAMTPLISVALTVLGINIHKRSRDKEISMGIPPSPGILQKLKKSGGD